MVRDEKERERKRREEKEREGKEPQDKRKRGLVIRSTPAEPVGRIRYTKPRSLHLTTRNETGSQLVSSDAAVSRPRLVASTEHLARSFRTVSGNTCKIAGREKPFEGNSRAPPIPAAWKPTPTKTSILREAAVKSAKVAKLKAASVKTAKNESPTRGRGFSFPRASPSRFQAPSPEKDHRPIEGNLKYQKFPKHRGQRPNHPSTETSDSSLSPRYQRDENSKFEDHKGASNSADPIFSLRSPFSLARRLNLYSTEDSEQLSSEWSVDTSLRKASRRSNTPQSPCTKHHGEFSPFFDRKDESFTAKKHDVSPSNIRQRHFLRRTPSPRNAGKDKVSSSSGRLLVDSPVQPPTFDPPFERFESDDECEHALRDSRERIGPNSTTLPRSNHAKELNSPSRHRAHGTPLYTISPRTQNSTRSPPFFTHEALSSEACPSNMNPVPTAGHGEFRGCNETGTRELIKSVRWDPAIVAVGRCLEPADASDSDDTQVPAQVPEDGLPCFTADDYLDTVTQSFAKLKKLNPKVIGQLLAALRDLKSDDESNTDTEHKRKLRLKPKPVSAKAPMNDTATKNIEKEVTVCELPLRPSDRCSLIQDKLASVIEKMKNVRLSDELGVAKQIDPGNAKKDKRWGEVHPSILLDFPVKRTDRKAKPDQEAKPRVSCADNLKSPVHTPSKEGSVKLAKDPSPSKLNPLAPSFRDFSAIKSWAQGRKCEKLSSPKQADHISPSPRQRYNYPALQGDWRQNSRAPAGAPMSPQKEVLKLNEPVWINTSRLIKAIIDHDPDEVYLTSKDLSLENHVDITPILTQPHIFSVPPGYVPLIPHPGYLPQVAPYQPTYPPPIVIPPGLLTVPLLENDVAKIKEESIPSEEEQGRVSRALDAAWSQQLLKSFQAKYPLTGTRTALSDSTSTNTELPRPLPLVSPPVVGFPRLEPPVIQQPIFQVKATMPIVRKPVGNPQQLAKKTRASIIQQALEIKILQYKEKKAAETKEIQKKQIGEVEKILPLVKQRMKARSADEALGRGNTVVEPFQRWNSALEWKRMMDRLSEDLGQSSAHHWRSSSEELLEAPASAPEHVWEYLSMEDSYSRDLAQAQCLAQTGSGTSSRELSTISEHASESSTMKGEQNQDLVHEERLSRSSSSTVVATYYIDFPKKPWEIHSIEEWHSQAIGGYRHCSRIPSIATTQHSVEVCQPDKPEDTRGNLLKKPSETLSTEERHSQATGGAELFTRIPSIAKTENSLTTCPLDKPEERWENMTLEELRTQAIARYGTLYPEASTPADDKPSHSIAACEIPNEVSSLVGDQVCDTTASEEFDQSLPDLIPFDEVLLERQAGTLKNAWETLSRKEWQNQAVRSQAAEASSLTTETIDEDSVKASECTIADSIPAPTERPVEAPENSETSSDNPWELQNSGKSHAVKPVSQITETGHYNQFKAPKYLWDFLDLEFELGDLQNLSSVARRSSRSSSSVASEALSAVFMEARRRLSFSQPKLRGEEAKNSSGASSSTVAPGLSTESARSPYEEIHLNFDWVPSSLRSSTVDISLDSSDTFAEDSSNRSKKSRGSLLALIEGSAAAETESSEGRSIGSPKRIVSKSKESTSVTSELGDGDEFDYELVWE